jgi:hypothetical protein
MAAGRRSGVMIDPFIHVHVIGEVRSVDGPLVVQDIMSFFDILSIIGFDPVSGIMCRQLPPNRMIE